MSAGLSFIMVLRILASSPRPQLNLLSTEASPAAPKEERENSTGAGHTSLKGGVNETGKNFAMGIPDFNRIRSSVYRFGVVADFHDGFGLAEAGVFLDFALDSAATAQGGAKFVHQRMINRKRGRGLFRVS